MELDFSNPWYPYSRPNPGWLRYRGISEIPGKIIRYLLDLPDANGYTPIDDNERPRVRLAKLLWYDGEKPLEQGLPYPWQKLSMLWNGDDSVLNSDAQKEKHPKGYRVFGQTFWLPAQFEATTFLKVYMGRNLPYSEFTTQLGFCIDVGVNYAQDNNMKTSAYSRVVQIEEALLDALNGVDICGVISFNRRDHMDNGSHPWHDDGTNIGRTLNFSINWYEGGGGTINDQCGGC